MDALHRLRHSLVGPYPADATEGRREYMTEVAFAMMALALAVCTVLIAAGWLAGVFYFSSVVIMLLIDLPIGAAWWLVRRGYWRQGRYVPVAVFLGLGMWGNYMIGLATTFVIFYAIAILLAGMLCDSTVHWAVLVLSLLGYMTVGWARDYGPALERLAPAIPVVGALIGIASLQRLSANQLQHAVDRLRAYAVELQAEVAERRRAEEELQRTQAQLVQSARMAAVGELAAGVAHELNNPLTPVLGLAELVLKKDLLDDAARKDLSIIADEARRAREIVLNLLDFARQTEPHRQQARVNQTVQDTMALVRSQLESNGIVVEERYDPGLPLLLLDATRLKQVWLNLFVNALQAMPRGGCLAVTTERRDGKVAVRIADTGVGIPPSVLPHIFEPFYTTKPVGQGTGLGLSVSLGIIQDHGGSIEVDSQEGKGSTCTVWLPVGPQV
jgi:signal transduction histidine kinase